VMGFWANTIPSSYDHLCCEQFHASTQQPTALSFAEHRHAKARSRRQNNPGHLPSTTSGSPHLFRDLCRRYRDSVMPFTHA